MTAETRPSLTVVIAATDGPLAVSEAVEALRGQATGMVEVIVAHGFQPDAARAILLPSPPGRGAGDEGHGAASEVGPGQSPGPLVVPRPSPRPSPGGRGRGSQIQAPPGSGVPRLRRLGLEAARGRVIVFTEDSCLARPGWAETWLAIFADPLLIAATGTVEHDDRASTLDRAVFLCEYAPFLNPSSDDPPARLAGNHFAVVRDVALRLTDAEVHETPLLAAIRREGGLVRTVGAARVRHVRRFGGRQAFGDRFRFGLEFGRLRTIGAPSLIRWAGLVAGPAIYASQVARLLRTMMASPRRFAPFARALPLTLALLAVWSLGEWMGWSLGPPRGELCPLPARRRRGTAGRSPAPGLDPDGCSPGGCKPARPPA
jgi:hypothetical protein